jgi:hypothetical protein
MLEKPRQMPDLETITPVSRSKKPERWIDHDTVEMEGGDEKLRQYIVDPDTFLINRDLEVTDKLTGTKLLVPNREELFDKRPPNSKSEPLDLSYLRSAAYHPGNVNLDSENNNNIEPKS